MDDKFEKAAEKIGCSATAYQDVDVCIPVTIKPFGEVGNVRTHCEGNAIVTRGAEHCPGKPGDVCKFTISQKLRVEVPVIFGAKAEIGDASVNCGCAENMESCRKCFGHESDSKPEEIKDIL